MDKSNEETTTTIKKEDPQPKSQPEETKSRKHQKTLDDTDLLEKIKEFKSDSQKQLLLQLNHYNNEHMKISDTQYSKEYQAIRAKYEVQYTAIYDKIRDILNSTSPSSIANITQDELKEYSIVNSNGNGNNDSRVKPIEDYWPKCIENAKFFIINEKDKLILNSLIDIKLIPLEGLSFSIEFIFKDNEYLVNNTLKKTYIFEVDKYQLVSSTATEPIWKDDSKDPSKKKKVKKIKKGKSIETRTITQDVESFFDLFIKAKRTDVDEDETEAQFIKDDLIPNSLEYYLDIIEINNEEDSEDEDDDNDDDDGNEKKDKEHGCKGKHCSHKH